MGPNDALEAVRLLRPRRVVPVQTGTWLVIDQDPHVWAARVLSQTPAKAAVLKPGEKITF